MKNETHPSSEVDLLREQVKEALRDIRQLFLLNAITCVLILVALWS